MMTDPIADMLTRIRNACLRRHRWVDMPTSKMKVEIARLLRENHYVYDFKILEDQFPQVLRVYLKYYQDKPVIRELQRVSRPGLRRYVGVGDIPRIRGGMGMAVLSTSKGLMTDREARAANTGGELLAVVY